MVAHILYSIDLGREKKVAGGYRKRIYPLRGLIQAKKVSVRIDRRIATIYIQGHCGGCQRPPINPAGFA